MHITAVIPAKDKTDVLERCLESVRVAAERRPGTRVVIVDNGSEPAALAIQQRFAHAFTLMRSSATRIGAVRNAGAHAAEPTDVVAFLDCDCEVPPEFFVDVARLLEDPSISAVGCEVISPRDGHWTELAWDRLHRPIGDGFRHYINSACFCVRSEWFRRIGGFDEQKISSEDVDICWRLRDAGGVLWQSERLAVIHHGNPKSVRGVYGRIRWHSEGIYERGKGMQWSVSTVSALAHLLALTVGVVFGASLLARGNALGALILLGGVLVTPVAFVAARTLQHRRFIPITGSVGLMLITFPARIHGMLRSIAGVRR